MSKFHVAKIINADEFKSLTTAESDSGVLMVAGPVKGKDYSVAQSYQFDTDKFTADEAKKWLKKNSIRFATFDEAVVEKVEVKAGARNSKADMETIQAVHDSLYDSMHKLRGLGAAKPVASPYKNDDPLDEWTKNEFPKGE